MRAVARGGVTQRHLSKFPYQTYRKVHEPVGQKAMYSIIWLPGEHFTQPVARSHQAPIFKTFRSVTTQVSNLD